MYRGVRGKCLNCLIQDPPLHAETSLTNNLLLQSTWKGTLLKKPFLNTRKRTAWDRMVLQLWKSRATPRSRRWASSLRTRLRRWSCDPGSHVVAVGQCVALDGGQHGKAATIFRTFYFEFEESLFVISLPAYSSSSSKWGWLAELPAKQQQTNYQVSWKSSAALTTNTFVAFGNSGPPLCKIALCEHRSDCDDIVC